MQARPVNSTSLRIRGILFAVLGFAGIAAALLNPRWHLLGVGAALVFLFLGGTALSNATQIVRSLRPFVKESVRVEVWGAPLPSSSEAVFEIDSVTAFGAGLLIHLRTTPGGPRSLLKVAQPGSVMLDGDRIEISKARYVSWAGKKLKPALDKRAPALVLFTRSSPGPAGLSTG
jgi:hypothetical protein